MSFGCWAKLQMTCSLKSVPQSADLVRELASAYETDREHEIQRLWSRVWAAAGTAEGMLIVALDDPITDALNHPAGKLADAAVSRLLKYELKAGDGLPATVRPYFDAIAADRNGHLGRVMLATRLHYLFAVDSEWVGEQLIPLLNPAHSEEASNLWYAYGWSRSIGPDLLQALKEPLLQILHDGGIRPRTARNLTMVLISVCLEAPNELSDDEGRSRGGDDARGRPEDGAHEPADCAEGQTDGAGTRLA